MTPMRWTLFFLVLAAGGMWLLIRACDRAPFLDDFEELNDADLDSVSAQDLVDQERARRGARQERTK